MMNGILAQGATVADPSTVVPAPSPFTTIVPFLEVPISTRSPDEVYALQIATLVMLLVLGALLALAVLGIRAIRADLADLYRRYRDGDGSGS